MALALFPEVMEVLGCYSCYHKGDMWTLVPDVVMLLRSSGWMLSDMEVNKNELLLG